MKPAKPRILLFGHVQEKSVRQLSYAVELSVKMEIFLSTLSNMLVMDTGSWGVEHLRVHNVTE